ncbi:MAG: hypothetical protein CO093_06055 [Alphaproteobacteria bacterium CG_4_9_14_3_um_filter_47_13]|nr:MAG: hypothetical protein CO093_06055 [Alphaproteobacteria bacterium CG_4_9_14_3_um_filter_47_13]
MIKFFQNKFKIILVAAVFLAAAVGITIKSSHPVASQEQAQEQKPSPWIVRCNEADGEVRKGSCEIFQRLIIAESGERVAELAIGFPEDRDDARGVIILPLGMMLSEGAQMKIDEGAFFKFSMRYCIKDGCYAFLNMDDKLLGMMRKGNKATILFKMASGKEASVVLSLADFSRFIGKIS